MTYDLTPMKAPRSAGGLLRFLTAIIESPLTGKLLSKKLLTDAGIIALRSVPAAEALGVNTDFPGVPGPDALSGSGPELDASVFDTEWPAVGGDFQFETADDFRRAYRDGRTTPVEVARRVLAWTAATEAMDPRMRVFIAQDEPDVMALAEASAKRWADGAPLTALDGVPVAIKDELDQRGYPTTVGTRFLGTSPATQDATPVARLRAAGAVLIGKTNMHEIGMGVTGLNPHHGACRNPYDPAHATGGSSSGPAAAVAAGLCPVAIGADGGGSIRIPAALCGIVGLKPTFGRVSEHGAAPLCWSVAHVGPMAATVRDTALGYALVAGPDPADPNTLRQPAPNLLGFGDTDLSGVTIGLYPEWFEHATPDVVAACRAAVAALEAAGATVREVDIPELGLLRAAHLVTIVSEMASAHAKYLPTHRKDYGLDTRLNMALARALKATDYVHAQRLRRRLCGHFDSVLEDVDVLVTPATARTAPALPADALQSGESNLEVTEQIMRFSAPANLTGLPGLSVPAGYDAAGLPIGLQIMGRHWDEALLLRLGLVVEQAVNRRAPKVHRRLLAAE